MNISRPTQPDARNLSGRTLERQARNPNHRAASPPLAGQRFVRYPLCLLLPNLSSIAVATNEDALRSTLQRSTNQWFPHKCPTASVMMTPKI